MKQSMGLVSIVVPVYNAQKFIAETIATVQAQTYTAWELILVDDYSTDESAKLIEQFCKKDGRIKLLKMKRNSGAAITRNTGIDAAKGRYLAFLDADDTWVATKLQKQVEFMSGRGHAFTFTSYEFADENGLASGKPVAVPASITYAQALKNHIIWTCRTNNSLSANKIKAMKRTWYLLTKVEKLGLLRSVYNFAWYGVNAVRKRL